jgi:peptidoglycan/xylan/chitin deacetylase (PgdA/CDA1 family)
VKKVLYQSARLLKFIPLKKLVEITGQKAIFPFYHLVSDENIIHVKHLYKIKKIKDFEKDLDFFMRIYRPLDIFEFLNHVKKGSLPKNGGFLLSFDDGLREFHDIIAPILIKKGIPAICFLNSGFIDNKDMFFRYKASILMERLNENTFCENLKKSIRIWAIRKKMHFDKNGKFLLTIDYLNKDLIDELAGILNVDFQEYLKQIQPYLTGVQIDSLIKQGFIFCAHSIDHPQYFSIPLNQQLNQTIQSIKEVTERFNLDYRLFSFPFTDHGISMPFFNAIYDDKQQFVDLTFGCAGLKKDRCNRNIQRIPVEIDNLSAEEVIYGEYIYYLLKSLVHKNIIRRD